MNSLLIRGMIIGVGLVVSNLIQAGSNVHHARAGNTIIIDISQTSLNRLFIKGLRIHKIRSVKNRLIWKKDKKKGEIYIAPLNRSSSRPINFFLQDESGNTYTVLARPKLIPSQSHQFVPNKFSTFKAKSWEKSGPYPGIVGQLIAHLYNHKTPAGYVASQLSTPVLLWKETDFLLVRRVTGSKFIGETYRIKNIDKKVMVLHEQEFVKIAKVRRQNVKGVAINRHRLSPNEFTFVHIVRAK